MSNPSSSLNTRLRLLILAALLAGLLFLLLFPVVNTLLRYATLAAVAGIWAYGLWLVWEQARLRVAYVAVTALAAGGLWLNGPGAESAEMEQAYLQALQSYQGSPYVWGGENRLGIDCSGLVRAAMIDANLRLGLTKLSPQYFRRAFFIWFYDAGADTLAAGFRGLSREVLQTTSLNQLDHASIRPGDFMVDMNGVHTMIYLGGKTWIEADPIKAEVIKVDIPSGIGWFKIPARIIRWKLLEGA